MELFDTISLDSGVPEILTGGGSVLTIFIVGVLQNSKRKPLMYMSNGHYFRKCEIRAHSGQDERLIRKAGTPPPPKTLPLLIFTMLSVCSLLSHG